MTPQPLHYTFCTMCGDSREADYRTEFDKSGLILIGIYTCQTCGNQERTYQVVSSALDKESEK